MKTPQLSSLKKLAALLALPAISILSEPQAQASPFIPGNVAVTQYGDGSAALGGNATPVYVLEYLPATAGQAIPVQTIAIPTNGVSRLTAAGSSTSEGFIARSVYSTNITFAGYDADAGTTGIAATTGTAVNRCVGNLDAGGNFTRAAGGSTVAFSGSNVRSAVSDDTNYWMSGTASTSATGGGIWYSANGGPPAKIGTGNANGNVRVTRIFNGSLYLSTGSGTIGIWSYTGIPTSTATATNMITVSTSSPYDFAISPAGNAAYINDDGALVAGGATGGGIQKWTLSGGIWSRKFTMGLSNSLTAGCRGMAVDFSGPNPVIYATTADAQTKLIKITDTTVLAAITNVTDQAVTLAIAPANTAFRGVALAPIGTGTATAPSLSGISPSSLTTNAGSTVTFTLTGGAGYPTASNFWYKIVGTTTNLISSATGSTLTLNNVSASDTAGYFVILTNASGSATSSVASLTVLSKPTVSGISPASVTTNAGSTVTYSLTATTGTPPASNFWYKIVGATTNLIPGASTTTLTLSNVLGGDTANYFAILTNASGSATSSVVSLNVTGDPGITSQPASVYGLLDGTVQFAVSASGTAPAYQWYFADTGGNLIAPVGNGTQGSGSVVSGAGSSTLTIANLQPADPANFVAVVTGTYGAVTSSVASLFSVKNTASLAFWNFNNDTLDLNSPVPYYGVGTAAAVGAANVPPTSPFFGVVDPIDGTGFGLGNTNRSWGTSQYPLSGGNKQNGVQFNASTVGAKNITVTYDSRGTGTASGYERLQYTTNGTDWVDYPASTTFIGRAVSTFYPFSYDLSGFPGVANNPNFGLRIVTEFQSTATYGIGATNNYIGIANNYGSAGTLTYDIVNISGDAITNNNTPPTISSFMDTNTPDYLPITNSFTVGDLETAPGALTVSAVSLNPTKVNPAFSFGGSGANRTLIITPNTIADQVAATPILLTVTDGHGDSTVTWFLLTVTSVNLSPTNSLTELKATNTLVNTPITIPFSVGDDRTSVGGLTYSAASGNNTVIPSDHIVINGAGTATPSVTITPASNQVGVATISVTVFDNDTLEPRGTTANIAFMVRPNTNVVAIDYFSYDNSGPLDAVSDGFWQHLSGNTGQMPVSTGVVTVDTFNNTENLQTPLLGAPYTTNSSGNLYYSFVISIADLGKLPILNGSYITTFNDGSGLTGYYEDLVVVATNGAAPGYYRVGILNSTNTTPTTAVSAAMFPQDLGPGTNYTVVTSLVLSNGFSRLWLNPGSESSPSVGDSIEVAPLINISDFELRESGANAGIVSVSFLKVGTTFDSVFPSVHIQPTGTNAVVSWSDPTLAIQSATNVAGPFVDVTGGTPYTNNASTNALMFFRFKP